MSSLDLSHESASVTASRGAAGCCALAPGSIGAVPARTSCLVRVSVQRSARAETFLAMWRRQRDRVLLIL
eukprot:SAG31_NODE_86_length_26973_cov_16.850897_9_plen_70_part_00